MIPSGYRMLKDGEVMQNGDLAFGDTSNGKLGWGKVPEWLHNTELCDGAAGLGHPSIAIRKLATQQESKGL